MTSGATVQLPDGRRLGYAEYGAPGGMPLMHFHGIPGDRLQAAFLSEHCAEVGIRLIAPERPGLGLSDPQPGRTFADWPRDVAALADFLGLDRFAVSGVSGGGAYVSACARFIPERMTTAVVIAGMSPVDRSHRRHMNRLSRLSLTLCDRAPKLAGVALTRQLKALTKADAERVRKMLRGVPEVDLEIHIRPERLAATRRDADAVLAQGVATTVDDLQLYARPLSFRLEDIKIPVHLLHGELDSNVPVAIARYVADLIPDGRLTVLPNVGHLFIFDHPELLTRLVLAEA